MSALESAFESQRVGRVPAARSKRFPAIHINGDFIYERFDITRRNYWYLRHKAKPFEDKLGYDEFKSPDEVRHNIRPGGEVVFVKPIKGRDTGKDIAIATREMRQDILVTGAVVVNEEYQKKGIGTHLAEDAILRHKPKGTTGRARKWQVLRTYEKLTFQGKRLIKEISPIDTDSKLSQVAKEKLSNILEPEERKQFDLETGLYRDDTLPRLLGAEARALRPPKSDSEGTRIAIALKDLGVSPEKGNAARYWNEIDQDVLEEASAAYNPIQVVVLPAGSRHNRIIAAIFGLPLFASMQSSLASFKK